MMSRRLETGGLEAPGAAIELGEPLAIFDLEIQRSRSSGEPEALSVQLENLADRAIPVSGLLIPFAGQP